ncbi:EVE domain-containing protein [Candidatus Venteria ishoeyi]|uniref:EVE domain-containing protein n=1 Tax=Candidatus Venteria ishoeyi TaxID=1899563 RepID=UPI0025A5C4CC|nr:EVE domain-containing protein [Candidatus Venteria ishoeyi]MDM8545524.1 EVE domain-containing protein [Candidatus Venteria ishoeyi]
MTELQVTDMQAGTQRQYWLMKSEPNEFSILDLARKKREPWDGVRNYQARNMMRDQMHIGDLIFFYHSNCKVPGIVGVMEVVSESYPDPTAFDPNDGHYDPKSDPDKPRWYLVDVAYVETFTETIALQTLKACPELENMPLLRRGNRLSVMPVSEQEWQFIQSLR